MPGKYIAFERCHIFGETFGAFQLVTKYFDRTELPHALNQDIDYILNQEQIMLVKAFQGRLGWIYMTYEFPYRVTNQ